ncbi:cytochrome P450 [Calycina marina]|uniref:sterol 22-desaturase n=1 Tax=Calycina marina TaxID=1763456 RepID=A0A9P7Z7J8_9HELO|nr:cytochrome P450 [Calycina marina]
MEVIQNASIEAVVANGTFTSAQTLHDTNLQTAVSELVAGLTGWQIFLTILLLLVGYDQFMYIKWKGPLPGPMFKIPLVGPFIPALYPHFPGYVAKWASGKLSCVGVFHKFVVMVSERDLARKAFNSGSYLKPCLVPVAETLLGPSAFVFLDGKSHVDFRKGLNGLFTRKALESYLPIQEEVWKEYFDIFVADSAANGGKPMPYFGPFREIGCALSCRTFVGYYISDSAVKKIAADFYCITAALELVNIPLSLWIPYSKVWLGKRAANNVLHEFAKCAAMSKVNMATGKKPTCIVDRWVLMMMESKRYTDAIAAGKTDVEKPTVVIRQFDDMEISRTLFTFLFASQDASSSSTTWLFQISAQQPEMLNRIRQEQIEARKGNPDSDLTLDMLEGMTFTNAFVKEVLRYRPPVIMVPYEAKRAYAITPEYTVPKGAMVVPSCYPALHDPEVYPQPESFDPERWISGTAEKQTKNWLVFGAGPHQCLAQHYVQLTMVAMIGLASVRVEWEHFATKRSEDIKVFATLFPMDDCPMVFTKREEVAA